MSQNPKFRRAYLIRPRPELSTHLIQNGQEELADICSEATVVMTEALPYEGKLEGYRAKILEKCKETYVADILTFDPLMDANVCTQLLGNYSKLTELFDRWWTAEEVSTLEIETTW